jgi:hypothetical protein
MGIKMVIGGRGLLFWCFMGMELKRGYGWKGV